MILETVSAAAVVLSLIFVAMEIRKGTEQVEQNTRALQIMAYQNLVGRIVDINAIGIAERMQSVMAPRVGRLRIPEVVARWREDERCRGNSHR